MTRPTHYEHVKRWHAERGIEPGSASFSDLEYRKRRARLLAEEFCEAMEALGFGFYLDVYGGGSGNFFQEAKNTSSRICLTDFLDALGDISFIVDGSAAELGVDFDGVREEIQRSNDSKGCEKDANGKLQKGPDYSPPNLEPFVPELSATVRGDKGFGSSGVR